MKRLFVIVPVALLCMATASFAQQAKGKAAEAKLPAGWIIERDIEYGRAGDRPLLLDMIRPETPSGDKLPVVAFIHGGGWRNGDKAGAIGSQLSPIAATGNYICVSIGYRLSGEAKWPAHIHDCKAAIRWLKANADKYNLDPDKIGVWGGSAGGHLVSLLGTSGDITELDGDNGSNDQSSRVACVVDYCGPSDFLAFVSVSDSEGKSGAREALKFLFGKELDEVKDAVVTASPATHVSSDDPPFLVVHGTADPTVPIAQAELLYDLLKKAGVDVTFVKMIGGGHAIRGAEIDARVLAFFDKHLRGQSVEVSEEPITVSAAN